MEVTLRVPLPLRAQGKGFGLLSQTHVGHRCLGDPGAQHRVCPTWVATCYVILFHYLMLRPVRHRVLRCEPHSPTASPFVAW